MVCCTKSREELIEAWGRMVPASECRFVSERIPGEPKNHAGKAREQRQDVVPYQKRWKNPK
jgi:hypothetical protein